MKRVEVIPYTDEPAKPGIAPWKFAAGALIHLSVPAYLLTLVVTGVAYVLEHGKAEGAFSWLPRVSLYFVMLYAAVTVAGVGVAALAGLVGRARRNRQLARLGHNPAIRSRQALAHAVDMLGALRDDSSVMSALHAIEHAAWHHDDERYQQLSHDLDKAAATYSSAHASARAEQRLEVSRLTAETLGHFAQTLDDLAADTGRIATQNAQTMAGYIASKYGDDLDPVR
jgi:hypothetical protein